VPIHVQASEVAFDRHAAGQLPRDICASRLLHSSARQETICLFASITCSSTFNEQGLDSAW
jgi:hypothetical protein